MGAVSFTSAVFVLSMPILMFLYYFAPKKLQNSILLVGSIVFYWVNLPAGGIFGKNIMPICLIAASVVFVYFIVRQMDKHEGKKRFVLFLVGLISLICVLALFKYGGFFMNAFLTSAGLGKLAFPLGISFYTFAALSYIIEVYRKDISAQRNFVSLAVFITFFGTITCGPIARAGQILPQLSKERKFDKDASVRAMRYILVGFFKQIAIANVIGLFVNATYQNLQAYSGTVLIITAILYAFQLYFEFAGYSDCAIGVGLLYGIDLPTNFKTPYFSTNFSGFWSRWHISFSSWLQDYVFTPLVWSRWPSHVPLLNKYVEYPPVMSSLIIVFVISGFWHGNTFPFIVWGFLQAIFRVSEELLHKYYKKPTKKPSLAMRSFKRVSVFILWTFSLIFFRSGLSTGGINDAFYYIKHLFSTGNLLADVKTIIADGVHPDPRIAYLYIGFCIIALAGGIITDYIQFKKLKEKHLSQGIAKLPLVWRWVSYYALLGTIMLGYILQSGGFGGNVSLAYQGF